MILNILLLPLFSSFISGFCGRFLGGEGSSLITIVTMLVVMVFSYIEFFILGINGINESIQLLPWFDLGIMHASWGLLFDSLTATMLVTVTTVSFVVHVYSFGYMSEDPHRSRFMSYLSLFTFFMLVLVTAENIIQLFVGWEGVGLCSYLLIGFWYTRIAANQSAMKAMIINRIGDFGLVLGISSIFVAFKAVNFTTIFSLSEAALSHTIILLNTEVEVLTIICFLIFLGAVGKSAQIGLHTWLPDAMEGPTPVSALIHAATMVTAGVFIIIRCSALFEYAPNALIVVTVIGTLTAFISATIGLVQNDLKKVIAYSTCSQLGYMVFSCGLSSYSVSIFHLMNHAFFKALLFLGAGCIIHAIADEQDMRKMGALIKALPFSYIVIMVGSLSLMGFPFLTGFYSKDVILELAVANYTIHSTYAYTLGALSAFLTAFYSFRLIVLTFLKQTNMSKKVFEGSHDAPFSMSLPLVILFLGSIFLGFIAKDMMIGVGTQFWGNSILILTDHLAILEAEFIPVSIKLLPVILSMLGALSSIIIFNRGMLYFAGKSNEEISTSIPYNDTVNSLNNTYQYFPRVYRFIATEWYFDSVYNFFVAKNFMTFGYQISYKLIDRGILELIGATGIARMLLRIIDIIKLNGVINKYTLYFVAGGLVLIILSNAMA